MRASRGCACANPEAAATTHPIRLRQQIRKEFLSFSKASDQRGMAQPSAAM